MLGSSLYFVVYRLLELVVLFGRKEQAKELEILVLGHELSILRRQVRQPWFEPHDRLLLTALSRVLPRRRWSAFLVRPETLLRWHRQLVRPDAPSDDRTTPLDLVSPNPSPGGAPPRKLAPSIAR